jgi:hypothetical protein
MDICVEMRDSYVKVLLPFEPNVNHIGTIYADFLFSVGEKFLTSWSRIFMDLFERRQHGWKSNGNICHR